MFATDVLPSSATVTSTCAPFMNRTSSLFSSVNEFSIRRSVYRRSAQATAICAFSGWLGRGDAMILSTVPGMLILGRSGTRAISRFRSAILADLAMHGLAISFLTLARVESISSFLAFLAFFHLIDILCGILPSFRRGESRAVPFRTLAGELSVDFLGSASAPPSRAPHEGIDNRRSTRNVALAAERQRRVKIRSSHVVQTGADGYRIRYPIFDTPANRPS